MYITPYINYIYGAIMFIGKILYFIDIYKMLSSISGVVAMRLRLIVAMRRRGLVARLSCQYDPAGYHLWDAINVSLTTILR